jgi:thiol-disulfide isomerase/thioredoxin
MSIGFPHYDSSITATWNASANRYDGVYRKRRGPDLYAEMKFHATDQPANKAENECGTTAFSGRWLVNFDSDDKDSVGVFSQSGQEASGTFLNATGDYRFLSGTATCKKMTLSCFDGAHAFLFNADLNESGEIRGDFWSSDSWHEEWTAIRDDNAQLPDAFAETSWQEGSELANFRFPDLAGEMRSLNDSQFLGKARIIYVFGSWCPNCHDATEFLVELSHEYADKGLSILGLAFEVTGDFARDSQQVKRYVDRHDVPYSILVAGLAAKEKASQALPFLDRVRSYPTTIFLDQDGQVQAIHTGFTGPATGAEYVQLQAKFKSIIEQILDQ